MRDAFPLKSLASCYLSQKQKQCSIVALNSFIAVDLFGGEDAVGTTQGRMGFIPELTQRATCNKVLWQTLSELFNSTPQVTPASKFASSELSLTAPTGKVANDSQKSAQMGPGGFCFFPAGLDFVSILPLVGYNLSCICVLEIKSV